jgi:hypothetical protein
LLPSPAQRRTTARFQRALLKLSCFTRKAEDKHNLIARTRPPGWRRYKTTLCRFSELSHARARSREEFGHQASGNLLQKSASSKANRRRFYALSAPFSGQKYRFFFSLLEGRGPRDQNGRRASAPPRVSCGRVSVKNRLVLVLVLVLESLFFTRRHEAAKTERETRIPSIQHPASSIKHPTFPSYSQKTEFLFRFFHRRKQRKRSRGSIGKSPSWCPSLSSVKSPFLAQHSRFRAQPLVDEGDLSQAPEWLRACFVAPFSRTARTTPPSRPRRSVR